jgi:hypothetical protein
MRPNALVVEVWDGFLTKLRPVTVIEKGNTTPIRKTAIELICSAT